MLKESPLCRRSPSSPVFCARWRSSARWFWRAGVAITLHDALVRATVLFLLSVIRVFSVSAKRYSEHHYVSYPQNPITLWWHGVSLYPGMPITWNLRARQPADHSDCPQQDCRPGPHPRLRPPGLPSIHVWDSEGKQGRSLSEEISCLVLHRMHASTAPHPQAEGTRQRAAGHVLAAGGPGSPLAAPRH